MTDDDRIDHILALLKYSTDLGAISILTRRETATLLAAVRRSEHWLAAELAAGRLPFDARTEALIELLGIGQQMLRISLVNRQIAPLLAELPEPVEAPTLAEGDISVRTPEENKQIEAPTEPTAHERLAELEAEVRRLNAERQAAISAHWRLATGREPGSAIEAYGEPPARERYLSRLSVLQLAVDAATEELEAAIDRVAAFRAENRAVLHPDDGLGPLARSEREGEKLRLARLYSDLSKAGVVTGGTS
jgi:hypothetical protein